MITAIHMESAYGSHAQFDLTPIAGIMAGFAGKLSVSCAGELKDHLQAQRHTADEAGREVVDSFVRWLEDNEWYDNMYRRGYRYRLEA